MRAADGWTDLAYRLRRAHPLGPSMRRSLTRFDRASPDELRAYQEHRLRLLVRWAAHRSPFYRRWFTESGVDPRSIRTLDDLAALPLLDRSHLNDDPDRFLTYPRRSVWPQRTGGTSGTKVTVYRSPGSSTWELSALERQWGWFGIPRGARRVVLRSHVVRGPEEGSGVTRVQPGAREMRVSSYHLTPDHLPEILTAMRAYAPHVVEGWPSSLALLATLLRDAGERFPVRGVVISSELTSTATRGLFREVFEGPVVEHYGQTERVAMTGNCPAGSTHVFDDYGVVELLPLAGGERFEIVGTPLHNWAFPLFRYRTDDEVTPSPSGPCPCGRGFRRIGEIDGRVEDAFTAADGRHVPMPHIVVRSLAGLREYQFVQRAPGVFELRLVPGRGFDRAAVEADARDSVERMIGPGQTLTFRVMDGIPRSATGKLRPAVVLNDLVG